MMRGLEQETRQLETPADGLGGLERLRSYRNKIKSSSSRIRIIGYRTGYIGNRLGYSNRLAFIGSRKGYIGNRNEISATEHSTVYRQQNMWVYYLLLWTGYSPKRSRKPIKNEVYEAVATNHAPQILSTSAMLKNQWVFFFSFSFLANKFMSTENKLLMILLTGEIIR